MHLPFNLIGALASGGALRVLGPDMPGRVVVARAGSAQVTAAGLDLQPAAADTPRFSGALRRLLVEERRTNGIANPRAEGGGPGAAPTGWSAGTGGSGIGATIQGTGTENGFPYLEMRWAGTATATGNISVVFHTPLNIPATAGEVLTGSYYVRAVGTPTGVLGIGTRIRELNGSGGSLTTNAIAWPGSVPGNAALGTQRVAATVTLAQSATAYVRPEFYFSWLSGAVVDFTARIALPQLERGAFASSPILPPAGSLAAATRAADQPVWAPAGGFGPRGTVVVRAMLPQAAPAGSPQGLWQIDDGTDQNRLLLRNSAAGSAIAGVVDAGGATLATLAAGSMSAGVPFRVAFTRAPGDQALCMSGGTVQTAAAALPGGLGRMLVGHASAQFNRAANGEVELVEYRSTRVSDALLQALANPA